MSKFERVVKIELTFDERPPSVQAFTAWNHRGNEKQQARMTSTLWSSCLRAEKGGFVCSKRKLTFWATRSWGRRRCRSHVFPSRVLYDDAGPRKPTDLCKDDAAATKVWKRSQKAFSSYTHTPLPAFGQQRASLTRRPQREALINATAAAPRRPPPILDCATVLVVSDSV